MKDTTFTALDLQVLITGASSNQKIDRNSKSTLKDEKSKGSPESHTELDSRLLSALLTVSINTFKTHTQM